MVIFKTKSTIIKVGNGVGVRLPNNESINLKANGKILIEVMDDGKILLIPIEEKSKNNYTEDKFDRLRKYKSI